jgi:hypothetical protein
MRRLTLEDCLHLSILTVLTLFFCVGCASTGTHRLTPDLDRSEVLKIMGTPTSTEFDGRVEGLYYAESETRPQFCVKLYRNRVLVYGPYTCGFVKETK